MINRRDFLKSVAGTGIGLLALDVPIGNTDMIRKESDNSHLLQGCEVTTLARVMNTRRNTVCFDWMIDENEDYGNYLEIDVHCIALNNTENYFPLWLQFFAHDLKNLMK